jgi:hypothetical protein
MNVLPGSAPNLVRTAAAMMIFGLRWWRLQGDNEGLQLQIGACNFSLSWTAKLVTTEEAWDMVSFRQRNDRNYSYQVFMVMDVRYLDNRGPSSILFTE